MKNFKLSKEMISFIINDISNSEDTGVDTIHNLFRILGMKDSEDLEALQTALEELDNFHFPE